MEHADIVLSLYDEANGKPEKEGWLHAGYKVFTKSSQILINFKVYKFT